MLSSVAVARSSASSALDARRKQPFGDHRQARAVAVGDRFIGPHASGEQGKGAPGPRADRVPRLPLRRSRPTVSASIVWGSRSRARSTMHIAFSARPFAPEGDQFGPVDQRRGLVGLSHAHRRTDGDQERRDQRVPKGAARAQATRRRPRRRQAPCRRVRSSNAPAQRRSAPRRGSNSDQGADRRAVGRARPPPMSRARDKCRPCADRAARAADRTAPGRCEASAGEPHHALGRTGRASTRHARSTVRIIPTAKSEKPVHATPATGRTSRRRRRVGHRRRRGEQDRSHALPARRRGHRARQSQPRHREWAISVNSQACACASARDRANFLGGHSSAPSRPQGPRSRPVPASAWRSLQPASPPVWNPLPPPPVRRRGWSSLAPEKWRAATRCILDRRAQFHRL